MRLSLVEKTVARLLSNLLNVSIVIAIVISFDSYFKTSPNGINKSHRKSSRDLSEPWHTHRILIVWYARQTELISPCSDISLTLFLPNCLRSLKFDFSPHPFSAFSEIRHVWAQIEPAKQFCNDRN